MTLLRVIAYVTASILIGALCCAAVAGPPLGATWLVLFLFGESLPLALATVVVATILWVSFLFWVLFGEKSPS